MMQDTLLALGLLLSVATQLRPAGSPIGPGEVCLLLWLLPTLGREVARLGPPLTPALSRLLVFWMLFSIAQSLGLLTGLAIGDARDPEWFLHDVLAYPLLAAVSCLSVVEPGAEPRLRRVAWLLVTLGSLSLALQLAAAWGAIGIPPIDPWYWDRLRGWSANPNVLALLCAALGLLSLHLAETAARLRERIVAVTCTALPIFVGCLTKSDTFTLILVGASTIFVALKLRTWLLSMERRVTFRSAFAWTTVLALPLVLASAGALGSSIAAQTATLFKEISKGNGDRTQREAETRFELWNLAISRGLESGMLGLGPGPHLDMPPSIAAARLDMAKLPKNIEHPMPSGVPNYEAHNTLLDLFTQGGLIAVMSILWLTGTALHVAYKARLAGLVTLLCSLCIFGTFHLVVRQPIFWFAIALCLLARPAPAGPSAARHWS
jgi:hypothetical protein